MQVILLVVDILQSCGHNEKATPLFKTCTINCFNTVCLDFLQGEDYICKLKFLPAVNSMEPVCLQRDLRLDIGEAEQHAPPQVSHSM